METIDILVILTSLNSIAVVIGYICIKNIHAEFTAWHLHHLELVEALAQCRN
jgi:hypothetical protein